MYKMHSYKAPNNILTFACGPAVYLLLKHLLKISCNKPSRNQSYLDG